MTQLSARTARIFVLANSGDPSTYNEMKRPVGTIPAAAWVSAPPALCRPTLARQAKASV